MSPERLRLADDIRTAVAAHADACRPDECCGLVASDDEGAVRFAYPLTNSDPSPTSYTIDPDEHFGALRHAESVGWELSGVFHSHPGGPAVPSIVDMNQALERSWLYLILGDDGLRGFRIRDGEVEEIELV